MNTEGNEPPNIILEVEQNPVPTPEITIPDPEPRNRPNQHLKKDEPKNKQFTGRATEKEFERIDKAIKARRKEGQTYDCVRLLLDCLNHIEADYFQTFKTK